MTTQLIFASHNKNKASEINALTDSSVNIVTLDEVGISEDIPETAKTLEGNAQIKARYAFQKTRSACFADDTGLEVEALNGAPGVYSARYAGEDGNAENNIKKLLTQLGNNSNRKARFRTVIVFIDNDGQEYKFEGIVEGVITDQKYGNNGFGYDPIFIPTDKDINPQNLTFAQMDLSVKNKISHRARAINLFISFLQNRNR